MDTYKQKSKSTREAQQENTIHSVMFSILGLIVLVSLLAVVALALGLDDSLSAIQYETVRLSFSCCMLCLSIIFLPFALIFEANKKQTIKRKRKPKLDD